MFTAKEVFWCLFIFTYISLSLVIITNPFLCLAKASQNHALPFHFSYFSPSNPFPSSAPHLGFSFFFFFFHNCFVWIISEIEAFFKVCFFDQTNLPALYFLKFGLTWVDKNLLCLISFFICNKFQIGY